MRCRTMIKENNVNNVVWFGSYGLNQDGTAKKADSSKSQVESNFSTEVVAIADTLTQKLSVMKGELWHNISYGLPLLEKVKSKALIDSAVADTIMQQDGVIDISSFSSSIVNKEYSCIVEIKTIYGNITLEA